VLSDAGCENCYTLKVLDVRGSGAQQLYTDTSLVEKYEMPIQEYEKLPDSVLAFKKQNKLGRFSSNVIDANQAFAQEASAIAAGNRCQIVDSTEANFNKLGTVRFVGHTEFKPGYWVGVELDEPLGRNNGTVQGKAYFDCAHNHGSFVRPDKVVVGDFPKLDLEELEELEEI